MIFDPTVVRTKVEKAPKFSLKDDATIEITLLDPLNDEARG